MKLDWIQLENFRNYQEISVDFSPGINVFIGENAKGKTSLLEAIYMLSLARSHRTGNEKEMINWQADTAYIKGQMTNKRSQIPLALKIGKHGKAAKVNHLDQSRLTDFIGYLNVVLFAPEDLELVKGSPQNRRKFIDRELGQMSAIYLYEAVNYQRIMKQRNQYLKSLQAHEAKDRLYLQVLTEQLAESASKIVAQRRDFIKQLEEWAQPIHQSVSRGLEELTLHYHPPIPLESEMADQEIYQALIDKFQTLSDREIERGVTLLGPHRDDLIFKINGKDVQKFGSQGQQRTTVLSMKLAEIECMQTVKGEYPILLLDDVLSELDNERQTLLLKTIEKKVQTFLTTTSLDGIQKDYIDEPHLYTIKDGQIQQ
ncbi:DNA replication/repair protein RecF [Aerococcus kribbianus]|uniref:DNA replication and repair protein RecF n=1 Tax=Aerococcus kribbianus TaxID=2999064 RepID=A0A9X3JFF4_9LACT|nr:MULTISPECIES: DNA replication/repair protein RecF [unclassified Aerococcus]MCZ0717573.1 DNA replication/repair protein RecF [Aerococcus sp. YH-aer221]MCZ0725861.1 DNA replication/repair protein RecF [Aerococcus sp. YH-aer222]